MQLAIGTLQLCGQIRGQQRLCSLAALRRAQGQDPVHIPVNNILTEERAANRSYYYVKYILTKNQRGQHLRRDGAWRRVGDSGRVCARLRASAARQAHTTLSDTESRQLWRQGAADKPSATGHASDARGHDCRLRQEARQEHVRLRSHLPEALSSIKPMCSLFVFVC